MSAQHGLTIAQQQAERRAAKYREVARLNKALKLRTALVMFAVNKCDDCSPMGVLRLAKSFGDEQWEMLGKIAKTKPASADARALVIQLLRERVRVAS